MTSSSEQPKEQQQREGKAYYHSDITPEVLENIQIGDWIRGIGDISCPFDQRVVQTVGTWLRMHDTRSRPHPAPDHVAVKRFNRAMISGHTVSKEVEVGISFSAQQLKEHDATIARKAREEFAQKIEDYIDKHSPWEPGTDNRITDARALIAFVRSLRSHPQNSEQEERAG